MHKIVILGAGVGGRLIAKGILSQYENIEVVLVGPSDLKTPGLFYFNSEIPGIKCKEIDVTYSILGEGSLSDYQKKSRGFVNHKMKVSSFNLVGKTVKGYVPLDLNSEVQGVCRISGKAFKVDLLKKEVIVGDYFSEIRVSYDFLISTIPLYSFLRISRIQYENSWFNFSPVYQYSVGSVLPEDITSIKVHYDLTDSIFYRHSSFYIEDDMISKITSESIKDFEGKTSTMVPGKIDPNEFATRKVHDLEKDHPEVKLCGRYARWDYHCTIDQSYAEGMKFVSESLMRKVES